LLAFLETDVSNRQYGYDLLLMPVESDAPEEEGEPAPTVMLMRTNVTSFKERVDKAAAAMTMFSTLGVDTSAAPTTDNNATSGSGSSGAATVEVTKPLNQLYVPPTKKAMIFGSSSASKLFGSKSRANAGTGGAQTPGWVGGRRGWGGCDPTTPRWWGTWGWCRRLRATRTTARSGALDPW
jgi:hypothetical protein